MNSHQFLIIPKIVEVLSIVYQNLGWVVGLKILPRVTGFVYSIKVLFEIFSIEFIKVTLVCYRYKPLMFSTAVVDDEAIWDIQIQTSKKKTKKKISRSSCFS